MKKRKSARRKTITLLATLSVITVVAVGGILAYLTDTEKKENKLTIGNVKIELVEPTWQNAITINKSTQDTNNNNIPDFAENITPTKEIPKDPKVKNIGTNEAWIYAKVTVPIVTQGLKYIGEGYQADTSYKNVELFTYEIRDEWVQISEEGEQGYHTSDGKNNVYLFKYNTALAGKTTSESTPAETVTLFKNDKLVVANMDVEPENVQGIINTLGSGANGVVTVKVEAFAIQTGGDVAQDSNEVVTEMKNGLIPGKIEKIGVATINNATIKIGETTLGNDGVITVLNGTANMQIDVENGELVTGYTSSNTSVATVNNTGAISVVGAGTTTITLTGSSGNTKEITLQVKESVNNAQIKVGEETVVAGTPIKLKAGAEQEITVVNGEEVSYSITPTTGNISLNNGTIIVSSTATAGETATITITGSLSGESKTIVIEVDSKTTAEEVVPSVNYGQKVNYSVEVNGTTLNNWKLFMTDSDGYAYVIYGDYLPNAAIPQAAIDEGHLSKDGTYRVWGATNRTDLINSMTNSSNWSSFVSSRLQTAAANAGGTATVTGGATVTQFKKSWNDQYLFGQVTVTGNETSGWSTQSLGGTTGYNVAESNNMYFPHKSAVSDGSNSITGYWLASPHANYADYVMNVSFDGILRGNDYNNTDRAFRPLVRLPSSILQLNDDGVSWDIAE